MADIGETGIGTGGIGVTNTDQVAAALDRLVSQFKNKTNIQELLTAFVTQWQSISDTFTLLKSARTLQHSQGVQLDRLGDVVGQTRSGLDDPQYRILIALRIGVNASHGEPDAIIQWFAILIGLALTGVIEVPPALPVTYQELYPAAACLAVVTDQPLGKADQVLIGGEIARIGAGGVDIQAKIIPATNPFQYGGPPGSGYNDGAGNGGRYAYVIGA